MYNILKLEVASSASLKKRDKKVSWLYEQGANKNRIKSYLKRWSRWTTFSFFVFFTPSVLSGFANGDTVCVEGAGTLGVNGTYVYNSFGSLAHVYGIYTLGSGSYSTFKDDYGTLLYKGGEFEAHPEVETVLNETYVVVGGENRRHQQLRVGCV